MAYTFERTKEFDADISKMILAEFPFRTSITLGSVGNVCRGGVWRLVVHGMLFTESGSGRDFTAEFKYDGGVLKIYDWCYDY